MTTQKSQIRFMYNGLKVGKGKLQKAGYSYQEETEISGRKIPERVTVYGSVYPGFSAEVRTELEVENNSDSMTDYFEADRIRLSPDHPRFLDALTAHVKGLTRDVVRCEERGKVEAAKNYRSELEKVNAAILRHLLGNPS